MRVIHGSTLVTHLPLEDLGEGIPRKRKKTNINLEKPACSELEPHRTITTRPLDKFQVNIWTIKELMYSLPQGPEDSCTTHNSYMSLTEYDKYRKYQKKQELTIAKLEKAYFSLPQSYRDVRIEHGKLITREKKGWLIYEDVIRGKGSMKSPKTLR